MTKADHEANRLGWQRDPRGSTNRTESIRRFDFELPDDVESVLWRAVSVPQRFAAVVRDERYPFRIEVVLEDGRPRCVGLARIEHEVALDEGPSRRPRTVPQGPPLTAEALRQLPLRRLVAELADAAAQRFGVSAPRVRKALRRDAELHARLNKLAATARGRAREGMSDALLAEVAELYDEALAGGSTSPTQATWKALSSRRGKAGPAYSTVARWISAARERGLLPLTDQGRARGNAAVREENDG